MEKILNQYIDEFRVELDEIKSDYFKFEFNTSQLPDVEEYSNNSDITYHQHFINIFAILKDVTSNCLYWFSVNSIEEADILKSLIFQKRIELGLLDEIKCRILPANNSNDNSTVIYVGVRKGGFVKKHNSSNIAGRIVQHLGYYPKGRTQGLQLAYYANSLDIDLTLHVYSLYHCPDEYLYILEKIFAKKLKPPVGCN
jgi:hypothetical protein